MSFNPDDEDFDAGPLQLWRTDETGVDLKDCLNVKLDEDFIRILIKGMEASKDETLQKKAKEIENYAYLPRFATYSKIQKNKSDELGIHRSFVCPTLPTTFEKFNLAQSIFINELEKFYNSRVVVAEKSGTGIVHDKTRLFQISDAEKKNNKELVSFLQQLPEHELGLSLTYSAETNMFEFANRSGMVRSILKTNPFAKNAFYLENVTYDAKENKFIKGKYTLEYHIGRSVIEPILVAFIKAVSDGINQYIDKYGLSIPIRSRS